ncbi:methylated-DNA--[protein]-cysteine S-methyltransferase [Kineosporia succinea]|uniref:Methylated-DNA--protein-cysteine methyltransferase n=1 Tax=Kineosporia succinea TaxID=84632 RepID=A0ABT9P161_9ACTN|nr:methylated-DNA--[protein]-cysteine S-methyltransferase [Kineosporia succinea]MDP9826421.1 methylated-DNA-[protein]-cysteine S-methyltransferase [Kineosporia succinea]
MPITWSVLPSPVGDLLLISETGALTGLFFSPHKESHKQWDEVRFTGVQDDTEPVLVSVTMQLRAYFAGELTRFDVPLRPAGTPFQLGVWERLRHIDYGRTTSYGDIAAELGMVPGASRAVGLANGANPISIIVPCHRVIGANGSLTGYGGGLDRKRYLLDLEMREDALF